MASIQDLENWLEEKRKAIRSLRNSTDSNREVSIANLEREAAELSELIKRRGREMNTTNQSIQDKENIKRG